LHIDVIRKGEPKREVARRTDCRVRLRRTRNDNVRILLSLRGPKGRSWTEIGVSPFGALAITALQSFCHCEERSDEAISIATFATQGHHSTMQNSLEPVPCARAISPGVAAAFNTGHLLVETHASVQTSSPSRPACSPSKSMFAQMLQP